MADVIYKITVDILKHTNFFRAFTASSTIPSIYIQQFWDTVRYDKSAGCYKCQLDEQWFDLTKDTLRDSLQITPVNNNQAFTSPLSSDALINFIDELGYSKLPSQAKKSRPGLVSKRRKLISSLRSVDESVVEGIPEREPRVDDEEADVQRALEESLKSISDVPWGLLPPVVIREPESGKYQPLPEVRKAIDKVVTDAVDWAIQAPLRMRFRDLPEADMKEILHQRMWETNSYKTHEDHMQLYEALEKSMNRPSGASGSFGAFGSSQVPPSPPPPPSTNQEGQSKGSVAPSSSKTAASAEYQSWITNDTRLRPFVSVSPADQQMDNDMAPDAQAQSSDDEDIENAHIPKVNLRQGWWKLLKEERPPTSEPAWSIMSSDVPVPKNNWASALASTYSPPLEDSLLTQTECHKLLTDSVGDSILMHNVNKPLPLGDPPGQVIIQSDFFFNKDLEYLRYGSKGSRPALSILKMKAAYYPDVGLEKMVPDQMWIEEECKYDIVSMYGISHWWFQRQRFYIDIHASEGDRRAVRTYMRILSVVRIEVFSMYGYDYMKKIVLRRADLNEHVIAERDFKYLHPNDFEDPNLLNLQEDFQLGIETYQTQLNLTKPQWDSMGFKYKHDYTVIDSLRAVIFWDIYGVQMIIRFNEIHNFSDGTLQQIDEALDYRVKEFKVNRMNPGLNTRFWTRKDVDRSKEFMFAIQKQLKTRRIFRNLESFVGG
nr:hypothetical protein [Tanacetum cinerariifolium]